MQIIHVSIIKLFRIILHYEKAVSLIRLLRCVKQDSKERVRGAAVTRRPFPPRASGRHNSLKSCLNHERIQKSLTA